MPATLLLGAPLASRLQSEHRVRTDALKQHGITPMLETFLVGAHAPSEIYVARKMKAAEAIGAKVTLTRLNEDTPQVALIQAIDRANADPDVHGILIQLPLPSHLDTNRTLSAVSPLKDVDGLHPENLGQVLLGRGENRPVPCTASAVLRLILEAGEPISGKTALVVGRSGLVGLPSAALLLQHNATLIHAHSKTENLSELVAVADIVVSAVGSPNLIRSSWLKEGMIGIDVGITRTGKGSTLLGDFEQDSQARAGFLTPVPGGVGPMTITMLMDNLLKLTEAQIRQRRH